MHTQRKSFQESAGLPILQANGIPHVLQPPMALEAADRTDWLLRTCVQCCLGANNYARATLGRHTIARRACAEVRLWKYPLHNATYQALPCMLLVLLLVHAERRQQWGLLLLPQ